MLAASCHSSGRYSRFLPLQPGPCVSACERVGDGLAGCSRKPDIVPSMVHQDRRKWAVREILEKERQEQVSTLGDLS